MPTKLKSWRSPKATVRNNPKPDSVRTFASRSRIRHWGCVGLACLFGFAAVPLSAGGQVREIQSEPEPAGAETAYRPGRFVTDAADAGRASDDAALTEGFSATYRDADVAFVVNQILGEFLKIDYSLAPDITGRVTLRLSDVRTRAQALDALRAAFAPLGIAVVDRGDFVAVVRGGGAGGTTGDVVVLAPGEPAPAGAGAAVVTPRYVAPSQAVTLIAPFAPPGTVTLADDDRRLMILRGEESAITAASEAIALFDVDWFSQISTGVYETSHLAPQDLAGELRPLLGPEAASVELVPLPRLSSLVVLARSPDALRGVEAWIARLDRAPVRTQTARLLIYDARYADAEALVGTLNRIMGNTGPAGGRGSGGYGPGGAGGPATGPGGGYAGGASGGGYGADSGYGGGGAATVVRGANGEGGLMIAADPDQNSVIARGDEEMIVEVRALLESLDRPRAQVLIEAAIVEVTLNDELRYGINWSGVEDDRILATFSDAPSGAVTSRFPGFSVSYVNADIEAALNLLSSVTQVEVVSRPSVLALHNETAELQIGDQVPIVTQSAVSVVDPSAPIVNSTSYRDTGVILTVTPRVRAGGMVEVDVAQEVSDVARTTTSGIDSPTITQRRIESTLLVPSGESVALGGLIASSTSIGETGIPILRRAPIVGGLFRTNSEVTERTELIVFLTPRVLADPRDAVDATAAMRAAMTRLSGHYGAEGVEP